MNLIKLLAIIVGFQLSQIAHSEVQAGLSVPSVMHGRIVPALHMVYADTKYTGTAYSTGIRTTAYYHSAWQVGAFINLDSEEFLWGKAYPYIGWGLLYSKRGYRPGKDKSTEELSEITSGPALRVRWDIAGPVFVAVESMLGLSWSTIQLNFQHSSQLAVGVRL